MSKTEKKPMKFSARIDRDARILSAMKRIAKVLQSLEQEEQDAVLDAMIADAEQRGEIAGS